jgi:hypothetical protein
VTLTDPVFFLNGRDPASGHNISVILPKVNLPTSTLIPGRPVRLFNFSTFGNMVTLKDSAGNPITHGIPGGAGVEFTLQSVGGLTDSHGLFNVQALPIGVSASGGSEFNANCLFIADKSASPTAPTFRKLDVADINAATNLPIPPSSGGTGLTVAPQGFLGGLGLSNDGTSPNTLLDIASGMATDDGNAVIMYLSSTYTKATGAWAVGTGNGALDTGAVANSTWYHVFLIKRTDTGVVDVLFSTSAAAPTMPTGYTKKRRIGSFKTDGSAHIIAFVQDGDVFRWATPVNDVTATNPGTSAVTRTLSVPTGVRVQADFGAVFDVTSGQGSPGSVYFSDLTLNDVAPSATSGNGAVYLASGAGFTGEYALGFPVSVMTNTSAQIRSRCQLSTAQTIMTINTLGWTDRRGAR